MTRRGPPGHLTRPSRGAFFLAASENSCHCPLPKSQLASAHRANKPTLLNLPTLLPNLPTLSRGLPLPPPWLNQRCFVSVSPGRIFLPGLDSPSSSPCSSKNLRCRFSPTNPQLLNPALPIFFLRPSPPTPSRVLPPPQCLTQRCFVSVSPGRIFLHGLDSPSSSPCSSKNLRCRFSPTNPQLLKSALPIFPLVGMADEAPLSGPTGFSVHPWTVNRPAS